MHELGSYWGEEGVTNSLMKVVFGGFGTLKGWRKIKLVKEYMKGSVQEVSYPVGRS